ncbi:MAG: hypothetical protein NC320_01820 [Clostridium sp.]|nr:hypothetical protein [Clostridium sp.]
MKNQFNDTLNLFKSGLTDSAYSTYWEWMLIPDNLKAAALYVNFYDEITLAWSKTRKPFVEEETAVSTLMQYIIKNVEIIKDNRKRFTPNYLYKVAFNAFYPLGRIKRDIDIWENRRSMYRSVEFEDVDDPDNTYYSHENCLDKSYTVDDYHEDNKLLYVWAVIDSCDDETKRVIESLIGGKKLGKRLAEKSPEIISLLKIKLSKILN